MDIQNLTALITGGASGLGAACVKYLVSKNAKVVIFDHNVDAAENLAKETKALAIHCDVADPNSVETAIAELIKRADRPRICINCAGVAPAKRIVGKN